MEKLTKKCVSIFLLPTIWVPSSEAYKSISIVASIVGATDGLHFSASRAHSWTNPGSKFFYVHRRLVLGWQQCRPPAPPPSPIVEVCGPHAVSVRLLSGVYTQDQPYVTKYRGKCARKTSRERKIPHFF